MHGPAAGAAAPEASNLWLRPPTPRRPGHSGASRDCPGLPGPRRRRPRGRAEPALTRGERPPQPRRAAAKFAARRGTEKLGSPAAPSPRPRRLLPGAAAAAAPPRRALGLPRHPARPPPARPRRGAEPRQPPQPGTERSAAPAAGHGAERSAGSGARSGSQARQPGTERMAARAAGHGAERSPCAPARSGSQPRQRRRAPSGGGGERSRCWHRAGRAQAGRGRRERGGGCMCGESRLPPPRSLPASPPSPPAQPCPALPGPAQPSPASAGDSENAAPGPRPGLAPGPPPGTRPRDPPGRGMRPRYPAGWRGPRRAARLCPRLGSAPHPAVPPPGARIASAAPVPCRPPPGRERGADRGRGRPGHRQVRANPPVPGAEI